MHKKFSTAVLVDQYLTNSRIANKLEKSERFFLQDSTAEL